MAEAFHPDQAAVPEFQRSESIIGSLSQDGVQKKIKVQQYGNELLYGLHRMHLKGNFCDMTVVVGDVRIPAHKIILSSFCSYFEAALGYDMQDRSQDEIILRNLNGLMVQKIIDFAYSGELKFTDDCVQELLETANFLDVKLVSQECANYIARQIDSQNFLEIYELGTSIGETIMINCAYDYIIENFVMLSKTTEFKKMPLNLLEQILKSEKLKYIEANKVPTVYNQEESILNEVLSYISFDKEKRQSYLIELLHVIRTGLLLPTVLTKLKEHDLVKDLDVCKTFIDEAITQGPCYDINADTHIWRKPRKNESLGIESSRIYAHRGEVYRNVSSNLVHTYDHSETVPLYAAVCRMKLWVRLWDHRSVIGGIEVEYTNGLVKQHGGYNLQPGGEEHEFILDEGEVITWVSLNSGFMIDCLTFHTSKDRVFGPYGGDGGDNYETPPVRERGRGYLSSIKCNVVPTQNLPGITHLGFHWTRYKPGTCNEAGENQEHFDAYSSDHSSSYEEEEPYYEEDEML